jgi:hypothetical protein
MPTATVATSQRAFETPDPAAGWELDTGNEPSQPQPQPQGGELAGELTKVLEAIVRIEKKQEEMDKKLDDMGKKLDEIKDLKQVAVYG